MSQLVPGKEVTISSPCLDCGEPIVIRMKDGSLIEVSPSSAVGHANQPLAAWGSNGWPDT